jgi:hypothetical protein
MLSSSIHIFYWTNKTKAIELLIYMSTIREAAKDTSKDSGIYI